MISAQALLDFSVAVTFDGQPLDEKNARHPRLLGRLVSSKGKWWSWTPINWRKL